TSTRNGAFQSTPRSRPLSFTSAKFFTFPRSRTTAGAAPSIPAGMSISLEYSAVPEKYFTPESGWSGHDINLPNVVRSGAPSFGGNRTIHGPLISSVVGLTTWPADFTRPSAVLNANVPDSHEVSSISPDALPDR